MSGDLPAGYNPHAVGAVSSCQESTAQARLCGWLPPTDYKTLKLEEFAGFKFMVKNIFPIDQCKFIPCLNIPGFLQELLSLLSKHKFDGIVPSEIQQALLDSNVGEGLDASHMRSMIGQMSMQNVAMNAAMMQSHDDGMSV